MLTSPETRAALTSVLDAFQDSEATGTTASLGGRPEGCGQINTTVYAAPADRTIAAFRASAAWAEPERACEDGGDCALPLRDVGPHPDVWIPAAGTALTQVAAETRRPESVVGLGRPVTLAHSPAVVAATTSLEGVGRTGSTAQQLVDAAHAQDVVVRSAEPHSSDAALDQLLHLRPGTRVTTDAVPPADDRALACSARTWLVERRGTQQALLTAESTLAGLVTPALESRPPAWATSPTRTPPTTPPTSRPSTSPSYRWPGRPAARTAPTGPRRCAGSPDGSVPGRGSGRWPRRASVRTSAGRTRPATPRWTAPSSSPTPGGR